MSSQHLPGLFPQEEEVEMYTSSLPPLTESRLQTAHNTGLMPPPQPLPPLTTHNQPQTQAVSPDREIKRESTVHQVPHMKTERQIEEIFGRSVHTERVIEVTNGEIQDNMIQTMRQIKEAMAKDAEFQEKEMAEIKALLLEEKNAMEVDTEPIKASLQEEMEIWKTEFVRNAEDIWKKKEIQIIEERDQEINRQLRSFIHVWGLQQQRNDIKKLLTDPRVPILEGAVRELQGKLQAQEQRHATGGTTTTHTDADITTNTKKGSTKLVT
ncbi:hypothetical protein BDN72DRAFT_950624 [Pluteus cervinus]|uniref:Uncharacterized protein n=1 Tax=Pluteus cervinus TaxID=181527 RepID=A0ACD2ZZ96_9AGAR|nr:hypothetical protein BDN72DRAFT_950624 [Pluteus cervinus]